MDTFKKFSLPSSIQQSCTRYSKGAVIFNEKDERDCAYIIEKGEVEISVDKGGKRVPLVRLGEGEVFGETALLGPGLRTATALATEECEVFRIFPQTLRERIMQLDPLVGLLMSLLVNRYRQWRHVSPDKATETGPPPYKSEKLKHIDGADDFLRDLDGQKEIALQELRLAQEMMEAAGKKQFIPFFQPIVSLPGQKLIGFEALIRWQHPVRGMIQPLDFIPVAERTEVVWHLDMLMLTYACQAIQSLQQAAGNIGRKFYIAVNLSGIHFDSEDFAEQVRDIILGSGVDPSQIVLEITESALMGDPVVAEKVLQDLKSLGLTVALDDFGTGYSSLSYLHRFSIDILKIDRSFVREIHNNTKSLNVVRAIVSLAKTFNMKIVAEGIELKKELDALSAMDCDNGQGFFFSKPLPMEKALQFVRDSVQKHG